MPLSCKGRYRGSEPSRGDVDDTLGKLVGGGGDVEGSCLVREKGCYFLEIKGEKVGMLRGGW